MSTQVDVPGYLAGTWVIDAGHAEVPLRPRTGDTVRDATATRPVHEAAAGSRGLE